MCDRNKWSVTTWDPIVLSYRIRFLFFQKSWWFLGTVADFSGISESACFALDDWTSDQFLLNDK